MKDLIKILTGRKLSKREMEMARKGEKRDYPSSKTDLDEFWIDGNYFVKRKTRAIGHYESREASNQDVIRKNYSGIKRDTRYYNSDGLLVKKRINVDKINPTYSSLKVISYTPSGSLIGKVEAHSESYSKSYGVTQ